MADTLEPVDENWSRALAIVAHPDDMEYGAAAAVARWTAQGKEVAYCLATVGEAGIDSLAPEECGPVRRAEQLASCAVVGVSDVEFWDYPDGMIEYGLPLRRSIARAVRRFRPDVVITGNYHDKWAMGFLNQADHIAVGKAVLDGVRDAGNRWVFRELLDEGLEPWSSHVVLVTGSPLAAHGVDVTETFELGVQSLEAHSEYLRGLGDHPMADAREALEMFLRPAGTRLGCTFAATFEVVSL